MRKRLGPSEVNFSLSEQTMNTAKRGRMAGILSIPLRFAAWDYNVKFSIL